MSNCPALTDREKNLLGKTPGAEKLYTDFQLRWRETQETLSRWARPLSIPLKVALVYGAANDELHKLFSDRIGEPNSELVSDRLRASPLCDHLEMPKTADDFLNSMAYEGWPLDYPLSSQHGVPFLIEASHETVDVDRSQRAEKLLKNLGKKVLAGLVSALASNNPSVRRDAASLIGGLGREGIVALPALSLSFCPIKTLPFASR